MILFSLLISFLILPRANAEDLLQLCANYSVWLGENKSHLQEVNKFELSKYEIDREILNKEHMRFSLPEDLTGGEKLFFDLAVVSREGAIRKLEGQNASAKCNGPWNQMTCQFQFSNLNLNETKVRDFLNQKYSNTETRDQIIEIATLFSGDPIGYAITSPFEERCGQ